MSIWDIVADQESSGGRNLFNPIPTSSGNAQGWYGITTGTWRDFAPKAGVDLTAYPMPLFAPKDVQQKVAAQIPFERWAPSTIGAVESIYGTLDRSKPLGELAGLAHVKENLFDVGPTPEAFKGAVDEYIPPTQRKIPPTAATPSIEPEFEAGPSREALGPAPVHKMDFEEAVVKVMETYGVDRSAALGILQEHRDHDDPALGNIKNFESEMRWETALAFPARVASSAGHAFFDPAVGALRFGQKLAYKAGLRKDVPSGAGPAGEIDAMTGAQYTRETGYDVNVPLIGRMKLGPDYLGSLIGQQPYWELGGPLLAETGIPYLSAKNALAAATRRALIGGGVEYAQSGSTERAKGAAFGAAVLPPIIGGVGKAAGVILGRILARSMEHTLPANVDEPLPRADAGQRVPDTLVTTTVEANPQTLAEAAGAEAGRIRGKSSVGPMEVEEANKALAVSKAVKGRLPTAAPDPDREDKSATLEANRPAYFSGIRQGEPFAGTRTKLISSGPHGDVYAAPEHSEAPYGTDRGVSVTNPRVIRVRGSDPYRSAVETTYPNATGLVDLYDQLGEGTKQSLVRQVLGREAKIRGYDSVLLRGDDPSQDVLIDYTDFKRSPHEAITKDVAKAISGERMGGRVVFARAAEDEGELERMGKSTLERSTFEPPREAEPTVFGRKRNPQEKAVQAARDAQAKLDQLVQKSSPDELAAAYGFKDSKAFANALISSHKSSWELFKDSRKLAFEQGPFEPRVVGDSQTAEDLSSIPDENMNEIREAIQVVMERHPKLGSLLANGGIYIQRTDFHEGQRIFADTGWDNVAKGLRMRINSELLPGTPRGDATMLTQGYRYDQGREYLAETLEHEMTHVGQYAVEMLAHRFGAAFKKIFNVDMNEPLRRAEMESQAKDHDAVIRYFFMDHNRLKQRMDKVPEEVKVKILENQIKQGISKEARRVKIKINQLSFNKPVEMKTSYFARPVVDDPKDVTEDYDPDSQALPLGVGASPQDVYHPEVRRMIADAQKYGLNVLSSIRQPQDASDAPAHKEFISGVYDFADERRAWADSTKIRLGEIMKGVSREDFDNVFKAAEGLRIKTDGTYVQTSADIPDHLSAKAMELRRDILDPAFEHVYRYKPVATAIIRDNGLEPTEQTLRRLQTIQAVGPNVGAIRRSIPDVTGDEIAAARATRGMLNFDDSTDLRTGYVDGYMTMQPMKNMRAELLNQIDQVNKQEQMTGVKDANGQRLREDAIRRLEEIDKKLATRLMAAPPLRDVLPKNAYFGPVAAANASEELGRYFDRDIPRVLSRYVEGIANKRFLDRVLQLYREKSPGMPGSVKGFNTDYINNLRGLNGYWADEGLANFVNKIQDFNEKYFGGGKRRVDPRDIRDAFSYLQGLNTFFKLTLTPIRFPLIQVSHVSTVFNVAGTRAFSRGLAYVLSNWGRATEEAMDAGVLARDNDFLKEVRAFTGGSTQNRLLKGSANILGKYTEAFRKSVAYHTFRLQAMEPGFKPNLAIMRTFIPDVPGRSLIEMAKAYGKAGTDATQFRLSAEGKPLLFGGGSAWRLVTQFKSWEANYGSLFIKILQSGDKGMISRTFGSFLFMGGIPALSVAQPIYHAVRKELLKHGVIVPQDSGFQMIANQLGLGNTLGSVDIATLKDPLGLPHSWEEAPSWVVGPTFGSGFDMLSQMAKADTTGQKINAAISAVSPQARAMVDAALEYKHGGVISPTGEILARRPVSETIIRGLDLSPSVKSQRYGYREDIMTALEAGQLETASRLLKQARAKGIIFGPKSWRGIMQQVTRIKKARARPVDEQME